MYTKRAELKVGLLVIVASAALLGLLFYATGGEMFEAWRYVTLRFEVGDLAPREGDAIYVHGVQEGTVEKLRLQTQVRRGAEITEEDRLILAKQGLDPALDTVREIFVIARAKMKASLELPRGTAGRISQSLTGSRSVDLLLGRSPENLSDEDTRTEPILVRQETSFSKLADRLDGVLLGAGQAVKTADEALAEIRDAARLVNQRLGQGQLEAIVGDLSETMAAARRLAEGLEARLDGIGSDVQAAAADLRKLAASGARLGEKLETDVPGIAADVRALVGKVDGIVERAAPRVDSFLASLDRTGSNLLALSDEFRGIGPEARGIVEGVGRDIDEVMELLTDTGRNLLDASEDLRAHPWKLLNEPEPEEIAYDNLRLTMQSYVRAMARMEDTSRLLGELLRSGSLSEEKTRRLVERTLATFEASVDRYRAVERRLLELLQAPAPAAGPAPAGSSTSPPPPPPPPPSRPR